MPGASKFFFLFFIYLNLFSLWFKWPLVNTCHLKYISTTTLIRYMKREKLTRCNSSSSSSSALQLFMSFDLLRYFFTFLPLLRRLFPIIHPHLPQVIPHVVLPLTLGLPFGLVAYGFHLYMVLATLLLVILSTCPNQPGRLYFIYLTIFSLLIASSNSSFVMQQLDVYY